MAHIITGVLCSVMAVLCGAIALITAAKILPKLLLVALMAFGAVYMGAIACVMFDGPKP
jgi:hypothetical protein